MGLTEVYFFDNITNTSLKEVLVLRIQGNGRLLRSANWRRGEESPDTTPQACGGKAYGLTTRREIHNARGANRDDRGRKTEGVLRIRQPAE